jgi:hypothetical protein
MVFGAKLPRSSAQMLAAAEKQFLTLAEVAKQAK